MGRLWQTLILARWNPIFAIVPVESMVHARQQAYYDALRESTKMGDASAFVSFMLETILETLKNMRSDQVADQVTRLLRVLENQFVSVPEMMSRLSLSHRPTFRKNYLRPALELGFLEMKFPDNPKHPGQRYRLTAEGRNMKTLLEESPS